MKNNHPAQDAIRAVMEQTQETRVGSSNQQTHPAGFASRAGLTRTLQPIIELLRRKLADAGINESHIKLNERISLPGAYTTTRQWDIVITNDDIPVGVIEVKSAIGQSFGNNFGNRVSELVALASDIGRQYETEELGPYKPCLGIFFLIEKNPKSTTPVKVPNGHVMHGKVSASSSYLERYGDFFEKLLQDNKCDAVCYLAATAAPDVRISEPGVDMGFDRFVSTFVTRIRSLVNLKDSSDIDSIAFGKMLAARRDIKQVLSGLTSTDTGLSVAELSVISRRRELIASLIALAMEEDANETRMHQAIGENYWLFGGQYVGVLSRRDLLPLDQHDIPLVCADGSLEVVELKGPESRLVKHQRNHLIVSSDVHDAVSQCMSYLRAIDELGASLETYYKKELNLDFDYRRAQGTVVIGHPGRLRKESDRFKYSREEVDAAIRSYNAHLSRLRILTYADLLESAERSLKFEGEVGRSS